MHNHKILIDIFVRNTNCFRNYDRWHKNNLTFRDNKKWKQNHLKKVSLIREISLLLVDH